MGEQLNKLLELCTVKLSIPGQGGWGTGFFVGPGYILTCAHVVKDMGIQRIRVCWQDQNDFAEATVVKTLSESLDVALLHFDVPKLDHPCVYLDEATKPDQIIKAQDNLYIYGYPDDFSSGAPVTAECEGLTGDQPPSIKFKAGQIRPGLSGSPMLNQRTGKVCGMVKFTRDRGTDLGGGAIPTSVIFNKISQLTELQEAFHKQNHLWRDLLQVDKRVRLKVAAFAAICVSTLLATVRFLGFLQPIELAAYDWLIRSKPPDAKQDDRILLVGITNDEMDAWGLTEISDLKLRQILETLSSAEPQVIGLDIFRDELQPDPESSQTPQEDYDDLVNLLTRSQQPAIIATCQVVTDQPVEGESPLSKESSLSANKLLSEQKLGFSDIIPDEQQEPNIIRRQILRMEPDNTADCKTGVSLSYRLASEYLNAQKDITEERTDKNYIKLGETIFKPLLPRTGGYQGIDDEGHQILLNYRSSPFQKLNAMDILSNGLNDKQSERVKGRIVLVGYVESKRDLHYTPIGSMSGVKLHAYMVSHVLSTVLKDEHTHPLIKVWPQHIELFWIGLWSLTGGVLAWIIRSKATLGSITLVGTITLGVICWFSFVLLGWWLPLIPALLGLLLTPISAVLLTEYQARQER